MYQTVCRPARHSDLYLNPEGSTLYTGELTELLFRRPDNYLNGDETLIEKVQVNRPSNAKDLGRDVVQLASKMGIKDNNLLLAAFFMVGQKQEFVDYARLAINYGNMPREKAAEYAILQMVTAPKSKVPSTLTGCLDEFTLLPVYNAPIIPLESHLTTRTRYQRVEQLDKPLLRISA